MANSNREFIRCAPIEGAWSFMADIVGRIPGYEALALLYRETIYIPDGVLIRTPAGVLAHFSGGAVRAINPRKAMAALERMEHIRHMRAEAIAAGETPEPYIPCPKKKVKDDAADEAGD